MDFTINIFTLNCWGIPVVSKNRKERFVAIANYLETSYHDVVCLQEIWSEKDYLFIKDKLKTVFQYSHYFYSGVLGSGLCVFSKWKIQDVFFHQWPLNGYIHKVHHGDWFGGKGVGLCQIKCHDRLVNIYCTHLHAEYHKDDIYLAHRALQAYSTAEFVKLTTPCADVSILAGDLNTGPGDLSYRLITQLPILLDPYDMKIAGTNPSISKASGTSDNANNSYSDPKQAKASPEGKRIDHILFHVNNLWEADILNFGNPLPNRVPGQSFSYSDHNAVSLEIHIRPAEEEKTKEKVQLNDKEKLEEKEKLELKEKPDEKAKLEEMGEKEKGEKTSEEKQYIKDDSCNETVVEAIKVCEEAIVVISRTRALFLTVGGILFMLLLGTVGFWPNFVLYDVIKIILTAVCMYYLVMGTLWNRIEINSLKAGLSALKNLGRDQTEEIKS